MRRVPILFFIFSLLSYGGPKALASLIPVGHSIGINQPLTTFLLFRIRVTFRTCQVCGSIGEPVNHCKSLRDFYFLSRASILAKWRDNFNTGSPCVLHTRRYQSMEWIVQPFELPLLHSLHQPLRRSSPSSLAERNTATSWLNIRNPRMSSHGLEMHSTKLSRMQKGTGLGSMWRVFELHGRGDNGGIYWGRVGM